MIAAIKKLGVKPGFSISETRCTELILGLLARLIVVALLAISCGDTAPAAPRILVFCAKGKGRQKGDPSTLRAWICQSEEHTFVVFIEPSASVRV
jgi:hypothetical protein